MSTAASAGERIFLNLSRKEAALIRNLLGASSPKQTRSQGVTDDEMNDLFDAFESIGMTDEDFRHSPFVVGLK